MKRTSDKRTAEKSVISPSNAEASEDQEASVVMDGTEASPLCHAKTQWLFGEWSALVEAGLKGLANHPERGRVAMLAASAHQQLGNHEKAREYVRQALQWGCPTHFAAQVLISGLHNTLGRAAAASRDEIRISRHFDAALALAEKRDTASLSHTRAVREMARMGLLREAAGLIDKQLHEVATSTQRPEKQRAQIKILETELELLHHELSLAQQRRQLFQVCEIQALPEPGQTAHPDLKKIKNLATSQLGQDLWVLEKSGYKRDGFFVEFGATDGVMLSNTWLLEKEFGWQGICAEPNPKSFARLQENRGCLLSNSCIGATTGEEVEFVFADAFGGMTKHADADKHAEKRHAYAELEDNVVTLQTISLHDFLIQCAAPRDIDYLSIDTEGSEFEILNAFPFHQWNIKLLTVEHNYSATREKIREVLTKNGYSLVEMKWDDWFFK